MYKFFLYTTKKNSFFILTHVSCFRFATCTYDFIALKNMLSPYTYLLVQL